jgi:hypothetical protein
MASGFIILNDRSCFITRWTGYDEIIRIAIKELKHIKSGVELAKWLSQIVPIKFNPNDPNQWGTGFISSKTDAVYLGKELDLRSLTKLNQLLFEKALNQGYSKLLNEGKNYSYLNPERLKDLLNKIQSSKNSKTPLSHSDSKVLADEKFEKKGPGWH